MIRPIIHVINKLEIPKEASLYNACVVFVSNIMIRPIIHVINKLEIPKEASLYNACVVFVSNIMIRPIIHVINKLEIPKEASLYNACVVFVSNIMIRPIIHVINKLEIPKEASLYNACVVFVSNIMIRPIIHVINKLEIPKEASLYNACVVFKETADLICTVECKIEFELKETHTHGGRHALKHFCKARCPKPTRIYFKPTKILVKLGRLNMELQLGRGSNPTSLTLCDPFRSKVLPIQPARVTKMSIPISVVQTPATIPVEWKDGEPTFSHCTMFARNYSELRQLPVSQHALAAANVTTCRHGWTFDYSQYATTVVTEWDMVCQKDFYSTLALVLLGVGGLIGNYIFGYLQDR
ncbi:hypothetical protein J6590_006609 [Homalodisca vitripennis]|nr:hypothetical protein J6590_006609 [Homalodisca vitripennis]